MIFRAVALLLACLLLLGGCESIFGKSSGKRGALAGKRQDVFVADSTLKADAELKAVPVEIPAATEQADWPMAGGSLTRVLGNLALSDQPREVWSVSIGKGSQDENALLAMPVVADGKVFTVDSEGVVSAFSAKDGGKLWDRTVPDQRGEEDVIAGSGLAYEQGKLLVTTNFGHILSLDAATGKSQWQRMLQNPLRSAPVVADGRIYVVSTGNVLYDLSFTDGSVGWSHAGIQETALFLGMASPTVSGDLVIAPYSSGEVFSLRRLNGRLVWEDNLASTKRSGTLPAMADIQAQPVVDGEKIYLTSHSGRFVALDARSGARLFEADVGAVQTPTVAGNSIFLLNTENQLTALSRENGHPRWVVDLQRYEDPDNRTVLVIWSGPVLAGGQLWLTNSLGQLKGFDPISGKEKFSLDIDAPCYLPPIVAGKTLYVLNDEGTLLAFR